MDTVIYVAVAVLAFVLVAWYLLAGSPRARSAKLLLETRHTNMAAARQGDEVKLAGRVVSLDTALVSPLTRRDCVYYKSVVEQLMRSDGGRQWATVAREERGCDFILQDTTGQAEVQVDRGVLVMVEAQRCLAEETYQTVPKPLEEFLSRYGRSTHDTVGQRGDFRCWESIIRLGNAAVVYGKVQTPPSKGAPYRGQAAPMVLAAPDGGRLVISDDLRTVEV